jgi:sarcosine/dimethylglycine N-methyltransferase
MSAAYSEAVETARSHYNSEDADNFYFHVWGGENIHVGLYEEADEAIASASRRTVERMAEKLGGLGADSTLIDLGAGYGSSARYLAKRFGCRVTALNLSETENTRNREMSAAQGLADRVEVVDGAFEELAAGDANYDFAWSQDAILHSGDRRKVIQEVARVLKPGGTLIFTDPMQADDCPGGLLDRVLERIHLDSLGSFAFYRQVARDAGLEEIAIDDLSGHLVTHYRRVREQLNAQREELAGKVSDEYVDRMLAGLGHWVSAGEQGYLSWGIMRFRRPV